MVSEPLQIWKMSYQDIGMPSEVARVLDGCPVNSVVSPTHRTVFFSTVIETHLEPTEALRKAAPLYLVPDLLLLSRAFRIIGSLCVPSVVRLRPMRVEAPFTYAVFAFPVIERDCPIQDEGCFLEELESKGIPTSLREGCAGLGPTVLL